MHDHVFMIAMATVITLISEADARMCHYRDATGNKHDFYCSSSEYCCGSSCCYSSHYASLSFYRLWYFWLCLFLLLMICSGGGYWYRRRGIYQRPTIIDGRCVVTRTTNTSDQQPLNLGYPQNQGYQPAPDYYGNYAQGPPPYPATGGLLPPPEVKPPSYESVAQGRATAQ